MLVGQQARALKSSNSWPQEVAADISKPLPKRFSANGKAFGVQEVLVLIRDQSVVT